jgi:glycerol-3-phosphate dehydrogenase
MSASLVPGWREAAWDRLGDPWDVVVVGGGITGAGIARRGARAGLRVLLLEQRDFGWGTSSRSSKLVHGGLRYLAQGQVGVVRQSVRERERLLRAAPGLVEELGFVMPTYGGAKPGRWVYEAGLTAYDLLARRRTHWHLAPAEVALLAPRLAPDGLAGGFRFADAQTDDARLTLRVALEAVSAGATVLSYARAEDLLRGARGHVAGVVVRDAATPPAGAGRAEGNSRAAEVRAAAVINATGAWADRLRGGLGAPRRIRPLRGSHLVFPAWRLPVAQAISVSHPADRRPVFCFPWEGVTLVGTTDVDHGGDLDVEPRIGDDEVAYLLAMLDATFPTLGLRAEDAVASFAGVRPVIGTGAADPSKESRDHAAWEEHGLLTITGGKLTTFDAIARDALGRLRGRFAGRMTGGAAMRHDPPVDPIAAEPAPPGRPAPPAAAAALAPTTRRRLAGRLGGAFEPFLAQADPAEMVPIEPFEDLWAEIRWAARAEGVVRLEDLLLRRVRLGLRAEDGGDAHLLRIGEIIRAELGWDRLRWDAEVAAYRALWVDAYAPPHPRTSGGVP